MLKKYAPLKDWKMGLLFFLCSAALWVLLLTSGNIYMFWFAVMITSLFCWIWFDTAYVIDGKFLIYKSGPIRGKILIDDIKEIQTDVSSWVGVRPALTFKYLKIRYNKFNDIFIAPKNTKEFIDYLKVKKGDITIG